MLRLVVTVHLMLRTFAMVAKCANSDCNAEFKRMGTGRIYTIHVNRPEDWGLPKHAKQKVVWLCSKCDRQKKVVFDLEHAKVVLIERHRFAKSA